jgi:hypothetical protein
MTGRVPSKGVFDYKATMAESWSPFLIVHFCHKAALSHQFWHDQECMDEMCMSLWLVESDSGPWTRVQKWLVERSCRKMSVYNSEGATTDTLSK